MRRGFAIMTIAVGICLLMGCTRRVYVPITTERTAHDTVRLVSSRMDSVLNTDTVRIEIRGDTVKVSETKWRIRVKEKTDTVYESLTDTIRIEEPYRVETVKTVERKRRWWETLLICTGATALPLLLILLLLAWRKNRNLLRRMKNG